MNKATLIGRIGKDAEERKFENASVISFTLATSEKYKDKDGQIKEKTEWHNIQLWNRQNLKQYLLKGVQVAVCGKITNRSYEVDGQKRYVTEIVAQEVELLSRSSNSEQQAASQASSNPTDLDNLYPQQENDGLPF